MKCIVHIDISSFPEPVYTLDFCVSSLTAGACSHQLSLVYRKKSMTFLWFFLQNHGCFFQDTKENNIFLRTSLPPQSEKKKKGGRWCVTHPPHRPRPPLLPLMFESPYISVAWGKREHYTNDIEKGLEEGWGCALTQFCWALCRPQPCRPIKVADAVQGPLTAADMPLAKHGESLAGREALSTPPPARLGPLSLRLGLS